MRKSALARARPRRLALIVGVVALSLTGAANGAPGDVTLLSTLQNGDKLENGISSFDVSADGSKVVFDTVAASAPDVPSQWQIYVKDVAAGALTLVSANAAGTAGDGGSGGGAQVVISPDGRYVAFASLATNLHPDDTDAGMDVFVKDLVTGEVTLASKTATGVNGNGSSLPLDFRGSVLAFTSTATNLSPNRTAKTCFGPFGPYDCTPNELYVKDLSTGSLRLVTLGNARPPSQFGGGGSQQASLTGDGSRVVFTTSDTLVASDTESTWSDVYELNLATSVFTHHSLPPGASSDSAQTNAVWANISADGSALVFAVGGASTSAWDPRDTDAHDSIYYKDLTTGTLSLVSTTGAGDNAAGVNQMADVSDDGTLVVFSSRATNLAAADTDEVDDVYLKNVATGAVTLVSITAGGTKSNTPGFYPRLVADGSSVFFSAINGPNVLDPRDTDAGTDLYRKELAVPDQASESVGAGGTVSTGGTPSAEDPLETSVTTPNAGTVTIVEGETTGSPTPGFELLGLQVDISAPTATAADPLMLSFRLDGSMLGPAGLDETTVQVLKDGAPVADCVTAVPADPDPCVSQRSPLAGGGAELVVRTSTASIWGFGRALDSTPPTIAPTVSGTLGSNGWYVSDVAVSWTVTDPESPATSQSGCATTTVTSDTTGTTLTCEAESAGGESSASVTVKRDASDPTVTCSVAAPGPAFLLGGSGGNVGANVADATSTPAASTVQRAAVVSTVGNKTVSLTGLDGASNDATATCPYRVAYAFVGKSPAAQSSYKVGAAIPVKFGLATASGVRISDGAAQALVSGCRVRVGLDTASGCASYSAASDTFQFDVKTPKNATPGSHQIVAEVSAPDGSGLVNRETTPVVLR